MKISKQSGLILQIVVFLIFLAFCFVFAMGSLVAVVSWKKMATPSVTLDLVVIRTSAVQTYQAQTPTLPVVVLPTLTPLPGQWTNTPTITPWQPTNTPFPPHPLQNTLTPETDQYLRQIQLKWVAFQAAYTSFIELHQRSLAEPKLLADETWKAGMISALSALDTAAKELAAVKLPDPNYAVYDTYLNQISAETTFMVNPYLKGVTHSDAISIQVAAVHLQAMTVYINKANQEFKAVKSRLATSAFSPEPSLTPTPD
jgi:hypothetical protein